MPSPRRPAKNIAVWSALLAGDGLYIGKSFIPVRGWNRYKRTPFGPGSSHQPGPMVVGQEQGLELGPKVPDELGPMPHAGPAGPLASRTETYAPMGPGSGLNRD